jgi:exodeoxyribonuclease X-like protein
MAGRDRRKGFRVAEDSSRSMGPGHGPPAPTSFDPHRLDFGHHAGRTIEELATIDPDYLHWLERHRSGVRYRAEIHRVLGQIPLSTDWER